MIGGRVLINITLQDHVKTRRIFPQKPEFVGKCDTYKYGIDGVWLHIYGLTHHVLWRLLIPDDIINNLVTAKNSSGVVSISDLEVIVHIFYYIVLEFLLPFQRRSIDIFSENEPTFTCTVNRCTLNLVIAVHILRSLALRHHVSKSSPTVSALKRTLLTLDWTMDLAIVHVVE